MNIKPATSIIRYTRFFRLIRANRVLDYGTGSLRNALYLTEQGFTVYAADVLEQVKVLKAHPKAKALERLLDVSELAQSDLCVDLVLSTYVFNIIETRAQRKQYLENVVANLREGGYFLIEVNSRPDDISCASPLHHYLSCDDKARSYTHDDLDRFLVPYKFEPICHYYSTHALAAVYRLTERKF
ncbi:tellurite resistance protein TehB-related SAM-dependent methyltransferase, putative [Citrifermentans bemidjiense Bem]|uniref:Tellurite resistance protein TehB-related SAM-dependent methyltransferase, putative n=1 Tax=Citrifermentans bemidjiense (strain ATCC BAA-1014 / DSM 16622 / JCM 12645 / Bem) TaxID=404380 RepID=B5EIY4_CITBB|nr:methyltransferase domain-containing protein [Citrifermentans bemidjiense]ACH39939.1 tellurite resistance protein TehB-related SAM-dependent methyltransferase, putative [Citrifermentans bemidjiense Bem]